MFWDADSLGLVISLSLSAAGIQEIHALMNPEKLAFLQNQLFSASRLAD